MANRPRGYGFSAEVQNKMKAKYEEDKEVEARQWMEQIVGEPIGEGLNPDEPVGGVEFCKHLKDGTYLAKLANAIMGEGSVKCKISKMPFVQMENVEKFIKACQAYGMKVDDCFQVVDLYEQQNPWSVVCCLFALGRKAQQNGFAGPVLGPKESIKNKREFTDEQLRASEGIISQQAGTNKVASQKGMAFGKGRFITDIKVDKATKDGEAIIGLQAGTNQVASQAGMSFGNRRQINDSHIDAASKESDGIIGLQYGTNTGASQSGMNFGKTRQIMD